MSSIWPWSISHLWGVKGYDCSESTLDSCYNSCALTNLKSWRMVQLYRLWKRGQEATSQFFPRIATCQSMLSLAAIDRFFVFYANSIHRVKGNIFRIRNHIDELPPMVCSIRVGILDPSFVLLCDPLAWITSIESIAKASQNLANRENRVIEYVW
jgi:hypothetical protein